MPYIKCIDSIVNHADACGGGVKKAGLAPTTAAFGRINYHVYRSRATSKMPTFTLTCCGVR
jgi:hypothetical protein